MGIIDGNNIQTTVKDRWGATDNELYGHHNAVTYKGDRGANTFHVGGTDNIVDIRNIGRDDLVVLEGNREDWQLDLDSYDPEDGMLRGTNLKTGNSVTIRTDAGRDDAFLAERIQFSGVYSAETIMSTVNNAERDVLSLFGGGQQSSMPGNYGHYGNQYDRSHMGDMSYNPYIFEPPFFTNRDQFMFDMGRIFGNIEGTMFPLWSNPPYHGDPWLQLLSAAFGGNGTISV